MFRTEPMESPLIALLHIVYLLLLIGSALVGGLEECDVAKQRRCRQGLVAELDKQTKGTADTPRQLEQRCRQLEEDLNCVVLQVTRCSTPNRNGDLINRVWNYMQDNCDAFGGWWSYDCFHLEDTKKCEKIFALRDAKTSKASCREFDRFRHCISDVVQKQCQPDDVSSMGNYLLDSAGDMVWTCPPHTGTLRSPIVDAGFVGVDRKDPGVEVEVQHHQPHLSVVPRAPKSRGPAGGIAVEESYQNRVYSSALTGDSPFVTGCNARANEEMRGCLDRHQYERDQALGARDDEDRLRKECCATWNYRRCLQNAVRIHCYDTREIDIQSAIDVIPDNRGFLCRNHWIYTCSAAPRLLNGVSALLLTSLVVVMTYQTLGPRSL
ncbi:uncharacterized protein CDAR_493781 [Caerostris darwini]|uniref:Uncharacterized protein n=1 Tax=Caerostris darwini TaxID=1538125 RepID=A0AAV4VUF2_9ARAC|nr:uncharacterized protein CDAR_493781 [Caerostris darwini]